MKTRLAITLILSVAACKPPATDGNAQRISLPEARSGPSAPIDSPHTEGAIWADSDRDGRIIYGKPGEVPLLALACETRDGTYSLHITRFAKADPDAKALLALVGNGHTARVPVDATWNGRVWLWEGYASLGNPDLDVLTGPRQVEATVPGAGSVMLNPSQRPSRLIDRCRRMPPPAPASVPAPQG